MTNHPWDLDDDAPPRTEASGVLVPIPFPTLARLMLVTFGAGLVVGVLFSLAVHGVHRWLGGL